MAFSTPVIIWLATTLLTMLSGNMSQQLNGYINPIWLESDRLAAAINNIERSTSRPLQAHAQAQARAAAAALASAAAANLRLEAAFNAPRLPSNDLNWPQNGLDLTGRIQNYPSQLSVGFFQDQPQQQLLDDINYQRQFFYDRQQQPPVIRNEDILPLGSSPAIVKRVPEHGQQR
ncbi:uncharacterized protein LOC120349826 [Nilaparvata lugens]|uniref:uncharacterized protein LOC120349826 n=1 Tax=Nilaparvata lugens TaxID=108931 RepID=UPI00193C9916|nr:uncharacterized protein LOC120349826 [Nilaparvata lugens]